MEASYQGHIDCVSILLENGADVDARNEDDDTALMWATGKGRIEIVKKLLENGANVDTKSDGGFPSTLRANKGQNRNYE